MVSFAVTTAQECGVQTIFGLTLTWRRWRSWRCEYIQVICLFFKLSLLSSLRYGQKCKICKGQFCRPLPFYFEDGSDGTTPWTIIVEKAVTLMVEKLAPRSRVRGPQLEDFSPRVTPPHETSMCQRCQELGRNCKERSDMQTISNLVGGLHL